MAKMKKDQIAKALGSDSALGFNQLAVKWIGARNRLAAASELIAECEKAFLFDNSIKDALFAKNGDGLLEKLGECRSLRIKVLAKISKFQKEG